MRTLSQILTDVPIVLPKAGTPMTVKATPEITRVPRKELEAAYIQEPITFNAVNKIVQLIMSSGYKLEGNTQDVKFFKNFFSNIGYTGGDITWNELISRCFKYPVIYGSMFIELIQNKEGQIVDLDSVDPKKIDYAKNNDQIILDKFGKPIGYVLSLPYDVDLSDIKKFEVPKEVALTGNDLYLPRDRIAQIKLFTFGEGFYPLGIIEPAYSAITAKLKLGDALANVIWKRGFPTIVAKYGDINHNPTPQNIQNLLNNIKNLDNTQEIAVPYWTSIEMLESKTSSDLQKHLGYYIDQETSAFGIPKALVTNSGESTNRATLANQTKIFELQTTQIVRNTIQQIEDKIMIPIARSHNLSTYPQLKWNPLNFSDLKGVAMQKDTIEESGASE